jgi:hypothetical protein
MRKAKLLHCLPVEDLQAVSVIVANKRPLSKLTIQARGIAHGGMSSLQKFSTVDKAVISKGIRRAS